MVSIVIPVFNEAPNLNEVLTSWIAELTKTVGNNFKLIVVDDGSTDHSPAIIAEFEKRFPQQVLSLAQKNAGHGQAILAGYRQAIQLGYSWTFQTDADNQIFAAEFVKLWERRTDSFFLLGLRANRQDGIIRNVLSFLNYSVLRLLWGFRLKDSNAPFRLIKTEVLEGLLRDLPVNIFAPNIFLCILAKKREINILGVPVDHKKRKLGKSSLSNANLVLICIQNFMELLRFRLKK